MNREDVIAEIYDALLNMSNEALAEAHNAVLDKQISYKVVDEVFVYD